jgi:hypothetical protein
MTYHRFLLGSSVLVALAVFAACGTSATKKNNFVPDGDAGPDTNTGDQDDASVLMPTPTGSQTDVGDHPRAGDAGRTDASRGESVEAGADAGPQGPVYCTGPLAAGDVRVVELMIKSQTASFDDGEWIELQSARDCILKLGGLVIESPWGTDAGGGIDSVTLPENFELKPNGIFVVADSSDTTYNHGITPVFSFETIDSLDDTGDQITVRKGSVILDKFTYPKFTNLPVARSVSFPADCAWSQRSDWPHWSYTFNVYTTGFKGTPNTDNTDVACPVP